MTSGPSYEDLATTEEGGGRTNVEEMKGKDVLNGYEKRRLTLVYLNPSIAF
jgi:hypothetical protein